MTFISWGGICLTKGIKSLSYPPGIGPFDKDPDDDIPFHGFDEDPED